MTNKKQTGGRREEERRGRQTERRMRVGVQSVSGGVWMYCVLSRAGGEERQKRRSRGEAVLPRCKQEERDPVWRHLEAGRTEYGGMRKCWTDCCFFLE